MKRFMLAAAAALVVSGSALAAPPPPAFNWSGFYAGANGGYAWSRNYADHGFDFFGQGNGSTALEAAKGAIGGFQWGWLGQTGNIVFGYESTWHFGSLNSDIASPFHAADRWQSKIDMLSTSVGRFGYSMGNWLPYVKAGWAWGHVQASADCLLGRNGGTCGGPATVDWKNKTQWQNGGTVGAGLDVMLAPNWVLGVEYDYIALASKHHRGDISNTGNISGAEKPFINMVTGRLSYKFN